MERNDHAIQTHDQGTIPQHQHQPVSFIGGGPSDGSANDAGDEGGGEGDELDLLFGVLFPEEDFGFFGGGGARGEKLLDGPVLAVPGHLEGVVDHQDGAREVGSLGGLLVAFMVLVRVVVVVVCAGFGFVIIVVDVHGGFIMKVMDI